MEHTKIVVEDLKEENLTIQIENTRFIEKYILKFVIFFIFSDPPKLRKKSTGDNLRKLSQTGTLMRAQKKHSASRRMSKSVEDISQLAVVRHTL